ncbi:glutaredoxin [Kineosporia sp. R_H_3]|uniref:glutaredoxin n=1 Tax=Kineosporia sp. R_H_3 TaxID=1961848 RepID=UPI000B4AC802|nr:glutaredoxin [Kineosporia sp. R_H_3]
MAEPRTLPPRRVTVVHAPGCHFCDDAEEALGDLAREFALDVRLLDVGDPRGAALVAEHHAPMFPLVLVDEAFFSAGRLPRGKLRRLLGTVASPAAGAR